MKIDGSSVGKVFETYVKAKAIDLLVMGAYRHSPAHRNLLGWGYKDRHRAATVLGHDVPLGGP